MTSRNHSFLDPNVDLYLVYVGMETDLIFNRGMELPGFASYPLLETQEGRGILAEYLKAMIALGQAKQTGVILESPTWVANRHRAEEIGVAPETLKEINQKAVALMAEVRSNYSDIPTVISANVGPRDDAYAPSHQMTAEEAESYHTEQISALADTDVDVVSGYTLSYPAEAIGIVRAAQRFGLPVVISFTVETDGKLPTGETLEAAIVAVDQATDGYAAYFMINCAHPDHFRAVLSDDHWMRRVKGLVANASKCSHAELDEAVELDAGDPVELGKSLFAIRKRFPHVQVLGGCCGTDLRHMNEIADAVIARQA